MLRRKPFYFLRHGQTDWNANRLCQGQTEVPLNTTGVEQAHAAKARLQGIPIATLCCSPMGRARHTAEIINEALHCPVFFIDDLQEMFFGDLQGKPLGTLTYADLLRTAGQLGGEAFEDFTARALRGIDAALDHPGPVLIVAHGGILHAFQAFMRVEPAVGLINAAPMLIEPHGEHDWSVRLV